MLKNSFKLQFRPTCRSISLLVLILHTTFMHSVVHIHCGLQQLIRIDATQKYVKKEAFTLFSCRLGICAALSCAWVSYRFDLFTRLLSILSFDRRKWLNEILVVHMKLGMLVVLCSSTCQVLLFFCCCWCTWSHLHIPQRWPTLYILWNN